MLLRPHTLPTRLSLLGALACLVLTTLWTSSALASSKTPATPPLSTHWWGVNAHLMWYGLDAAVADLDKVQAAGLTRVRFDLNWAVFEPQAKSGWDEAYLTKLDGVIAAAYARGITPTITVLTTPAWARHNAGSQFTPPDKAADFADAIGHVAGRYTEVPGVAWEIWNEPNQIQFWDMPGGPDPVGYAGLLRAAYPAIKSAAPFAAVLGGSIAFNDQAYLSAMYSAGQVKGYFDALALHPYSLNYAPESTVSAFESFGLAVTRSEQTMAQYGEPGKPIWITEMGWSTIGVSDYNRMAYFQKAVQMVRTWPYVREFDVYALSQAEDFPDMGLIGGNGISTGSWITYVQAVRQT
jgi:hypothetical protein